MKHTSYISLGANLGDRGECMRTALRRMAACVGISLERISSFYETPPWGNIDQPPFLNAAARISFCGTPHHLLEQLQSIEYALGRVRREHWGARTIDLDILHIEGVTTEDDMLTLPHPYLTQRAFVLVPLAEIAPALVLHGKTVAEWCSLSDCAGIVRAAELSGPYPLELIAAADEEGGIGRAGGLLTHCKEDMAHFRRQTMGGIVIMGRRTMESLPDKRPLAGRENIVLSSRLQGASGFCIVPNVPALWNLLGQLTLDASRRIFTIGGAECYRALLPYVHQAYVTRLPGIYGADTFLPPLKGFALTERRTGEHCIFEIYKRI